MQTSKKSSLVQKMHFPTIFIYSTSTIMVLIWLLINGYNTNKLGYFFHLSVNENIMYDF